MENKIGSKLYTSVEVIYHFNYIWKKRCGSMERLCEIFSKVGCILFI
ncbi:MAG: hypothetical protein HFI13_11070 [Lachnospiraceae bacterium]|nr:hypothetical protein [Lachnospiraceae bacterium]